MHTQINEFAVFKSCILTVPGRMAKCSE